MTANTNRILIVDDNENNRDMLARRLERKGYVVTTAASARDILARIERDEADLVLLDIEMPDITGLDALQLIRANYSSIQTPVIMVTALNQSPGSRR
jgi:CheY-like chemotaxis protein